MGPVLTGGVGSGAGVQRCPGTASWSLFLSTGPSLLRSTNRKPPGRTKGANRAVGDLWTAGLASRLPRASTVLGESSTGHCAWALETSRGEPRHYAM